MKDLSFVNGLARSKESSLITFDKLSRMLSADSAGEAFSLLKDYGFGKSADAGYYTEYEKLIFAENEALNEFIREYSPSKSFTAYMFLKNDFHNAEIAVRGKYVKGLNAYKADGLTEKAAIIAFSEGKKADVPQYLIQPMKDADAAVKNGAGGAEVADIFVKACYKAALKLVGGEFGEFIRKEIDFKNLSAAVRCEDVGVFRRQFISGGNVGREKFIRIAEKNYIKARNDFKYTGFSEEVDLALSAAEAGKPLVAFERYAESYPLRKLSEKKYEPSGIVPFAMYCLYKANELKNVRIIMVGKIAGLKADEIKGRLKDGYVG